MGSSSYGNCALLMVQSQVPNLQSCSRRLVVHALSLVCASLLKQLVLLLLLDLSDSDDVLLLHMTITGFQPVSGIRTNLANVVSAGGGFKCQ